MLFDSYVTSKNISQIKFFVSIKVNSPTNSYRSKDNKFNIVCPHRMMLELIAGNS